MGEIADMMLEGDLCAGCGEYMGGEGDGFPRYCSADCAPEGMEDFIFDDDDFVQSFKQPKKNKEGGTVATLQSERDRAMNSAIALHKVLKELLEKVQCGTCLQCDLCDEARQQIKKADKMFSKIRGPHRATTTEENKC